MEDPWTKLEEKIDRLDGKVTSLDGKVTSLDGKVTGLSAQVMDLGAEIHKHGLLLESMDDGLKLTLERTLSLRESMDRGFADVMKRLDERVQPIEAASRHLAAHISSAKRRRK